ncbi:Uncharacterised protein [Amycolatopsis camponoti]|uniref:DUF397 domain-containing protein n=1 Tax=Amycolatopsis camponoti TaxID=2606593 RepID=A0A6I8LRJ7_9PSEU|nr:DUF397 domain-containing protein [Amycolatopsis camponoti]VVJ19473.1 Uncharacterised protein [Amycolatopsis camponoti]
MTTAPATKTRDPDKWFKSSYSNAGGSCVEVRMTCKNVAIRDSKDSESHSPTISSSPPAWSAFVQVIKTL